MRLLAKQVPYLSSHIPRIGAGNENRTRIPSLATTDSTLEPYPHGGAGRIRTSDLLGNLSALPWCSNRLSYHATEISSLSHGYLRQS